jgi:2-polyprenyl-3-methyl-5-hydroxy-6-metoxy-1,4-benzoquinol methylase
VDDALVKNSLAYRKNEDRILRGDVPQKYLRIVPFVTGDSILEIGSAEGVLALLLAKQGKSVTAIERRAERHEAAQRLRDSWGVEGVRFICGDIRNNLFRFEGIDTLLCVRSIYYLGDELDDVFAEATKHVRNVVLCGNKNRARWWREGLPNRNDRADNYYASADGMRDVLCRHGFEIKNEVLDGDPIVVGYRPD